MRRRTRPKVIWLPQTNKFSIGAGFQTYQAGLQTIAGPTGNNSTIEFPLVADAQLSILDSATMSIADVAKSGYRLRRIVGKLWCKVDQSTNDTPQTILATAGIIVRHAETSTGESTAAQSGADNINTGLIDNTGDPWIWRRSWWLMNRTHPDLIAANEFMPRANFGPEYPGGIAEGPHIDQKTARVVSAEERLFLDCTLTVIDEGSPGDIDLTVQWLTDFRILGSLMSVSGNRNNSSR